MKKYIPILIITSLLLSACNIDWSDKDDLFEKKQECVKYEKRMREIAIDEFGSKSRFVEIFYSPKKQSCYFIVRDDHGFDKSQPKGSWGIMSADYLYDFLNSKLEAEFEFIDCYNDDLKTYNFCMDERGKNQNKFEKTVKELKGE